MPRRCGSPTATPDSEWRRHRNIERRLRLAIIRVKRWRGSAVAAGSTGIGAVIRLFREDPWLEVVGPGTVLDIEAREPGTKHATSLQQVERWLAGATANPSEASRKAKLKMMLMNG